MKPTAKDGNLFSHPWTERGANDLRSELEVRTPMGSSNLVRRPRRVVGERQQDGKRFREEILLQQLESVMGVTGAYWAGVWGWGGNTFSFFQER